LNQKEVQREALHLESIASKIAELQKEENTLKKGILDEKRKISRIKPRILEIETQLTEIRSEPEMSDDLQELKDSCTEKRKQLESTQAREEELQTKINQMSEELEKKKEVHNEKKKKLSQELETSSGPIERQLNELERLISEKRKLIKNQEHAKLGHQRLLQDMQEDSKKIKLRLAAERKAAETLTKGCVMNPSNTVPQIEAKIKMIREKKKKNPTEVARRRRDEIGEVYREKQILLAEQKSKLETLKKLATDMENANWLRRDVFHLIRKFICARVRRQFNYNSARFSHEYGHRVYVNIDHTTRELNFVFRSQDGDRVHVDVNSLSGGEKSCTQMCLISSLWTTMNPPFRALDEWEVFLDNVNRKEIALRLLDFGLTSENFQFIFISPQGIGDIDKELKDEDREKVKIVEIKKNA